MKRIAILCALAALTACGSQSGGGNSTAASVAHVGSEAPAFDEKTVGGGDLSMASLRGKPVYLNFFASWCPPCNEEAPDVRAVAQEFKPRGLQVVGVDVLEDEQKAKKFVDEHDLNYPAVVDTGALRDAYNINGMPVHVFINKDGIVKKIEIGELSKAEMIADVKTVL
ncbi:MAG TPA: TlpA disulfide reductase family protein [Candidatus Aquilonibacter sp.]|nr:TlpA disulfide reductase family protein [Candidatus Aquilonibacter sp.]